ncbi:MAG TPA: response regulator [Herpetosiphonaceae bacterium]
MNREAPRILVIDDDEAVRRTLAELLRRDAYIVATAPNGQAALALVEHEVFDLVLLDLWMPGLSSWEVAQRLLAQRPTLAILVLTGDSMAEYERERWLAAGIEYLLKTSAPWDVLRRIAAALAEREVAM